jgi:anaphase-promoting complex subunit 11
MKFSITAYHAVATWKWDTSTEPHKLYHYARGRGTGNGNAYDEDDEDYDEDEDEDDVCGICRLAFESACPGCKVPGDDCPLSEHAHFAALTWEER